MPELIATLVVVPPSGVAREVEISEGIISIGRAMDNTISVEGDTSISRYHTEIEARDDGFWVYDLGSSNGTTVNDEPVKEDRLLKDGDTISVGGETYIEFHYGRKKTFKDEEDEEEQKPSSSAASAGGGSAPVPAKPTLAAPAAPSSGGIPVLLIIAGILGGLAVLAVAGIILYMIFGSSCPGDVVIISPQSGSVISGPTKIQVDFQKGDEKCIDRVIYQIDGNSYRDLEIESAPYEATLDPGAIPGFADGSVHILTIIVEDLKGNKKVQNQAVKLSYGIAPPPSPDGNPSPGSTQGGGNQNGGNTAPPPTKDPKIMSEGLATKIAGRTGFVFSPQFMSMVNARMSEYRVAGNAGAKAQAFKREINKAFRDRGVNPLVGYILAMSRSKFNPNAKNGQELGLWQINPAVVRAPNHLTANEQDTALADPKRGAEIAAAYLDDLISRFGDGGFMYAIACFGMSLEDVGKFRLQLEQKDPTGTARLDFMQMVNAGIVTPEMQDRVVRFMAAGIVGDNPGAFGLPDPPLSSL